VVADGTKQTVNATLSDIPSGTYYVRLVVIEDPGTSTSRPLYSDPQQPFTIAPREVGTGEATMLDDPAGTVQLNGYFTMPAGTPVTSYYQYGPCPLDSNTATSTAPVTTIATGSRQATASADLTGLTAGTYCYTTVVVTTDSSGNPVYSYGDSESFTVEPTADVEVTTSAVTNVDEPAGVATLNGLVDFPSGTPLQYYFEYR
jgi:hypothetical protein